MLIQLWQCIVGVVVDAVDLGWGNPGIWLGFGFLVRGWWNQNRDRNELVRMVDRVFENNQTCIVDFKKKTVDQRCVDDRLNR